MASAATALSRRARAADTALRLLAAAGLGVNAYIHAKLADQYDLVQSATLSEGDLFRLEAGLDSLAALLVLILHRPVTAAFAWLAAAGGLAVLMIYRYDDLGAWGPFPDMYEPIWSNDKWAAAIAQAVTVAAATALLVMHWIRWRRARTTPPRVA